MSEKIRLPPRLHFCLIVISMFLLVMSSVFLLFSDGSLTPRSVFKLILINNTSHYTNPNDLEEHIIFPKTPILVEKETPLTIKPDSSETPRPKTACDSARAQLRVYMYDLPPEFHFGLLGWKGRENEKWPGVDDRSRIPGYPGGLNLQHSVEYWLTLDLLSSNLPTISRPCTAIRVKNSSQADVLFVPFFASLSYNRHSKLRGKEKASLDKRLQEKLVRFLTRRDEWKRRSGKDHLIVAHHPNSLLQARSDLGSAMFVLADFGRYPVELANLDKDVIAPYIHLVPSVPVDKSPSFSQRPTLVYFKGAIYRKDGGVMRQELYYLLKEERDVEFEFGSIGGRGAGIGEAGRGMSSSKFCLHIAGDTPSSNRLFDAISSHCVPVIVSDDLELPFEDVLDYSTFCVFVRASDAVRDNYLIALLRGVSESAWTVMWNRMKEISGSFEYRFPSEPGDAVDMIWEAVSRKKSKSSVRSDRHRNNRVERHRGSGRRQVKHVPLRTLLR